MRPPARDIAQVRSFNRLVTSQVGALQDRYLDRRPLGEARVLFEIGSRGATARDVRARLGLDSGYLSRLIRSLERDGLVTSGRDPGDGRTTRLRLTRGGRSGDARPRPDVRRARGVGARPARRAPSASVCCARRRRSGGCSPSRWSRWRRRTRGAPTRAGASRATSRSWASGSARASTRRGRCRRTPPTSSPPDGAFVLARIQRRAGGLRRAQAARRRDRRADADVGRRRAPRARDRHADPRRARGACGGARPHARPALHERRARRGAGAVPVARLRRDRPLQRRPVRRALLREAAGGPSFPRGAGKPRGRRATPAAARRPPAPAPTAAA